MTIVQLASYNPTTGVLQALYQFMGTAAEASAFAAAHPTFTNITAQAAAASATFTQLQASAMNVTTKAVTL